MHCNIKISKLFSCTFRYNKILKSFFHSQSFNQHRIIFADNHWHYQFEKSLPFLLFHKIVFKILRRSKSYSSNKIALQIKLLRHGIQFIGYETSNYFLFTKTNFWLEMIFLLFSKLNMFNFIWIKNLDNVSWPDFQLGLPNITYEKRVFSLIHLNGCDVEQWCWWLYAGGSFKMSVVKSLTCW